MQYLGLVVALAGCGRIAIDPLADAAPPPADLAPDVLACAPGYAPQPGRTSQYRLVPTPRTWFAAEADCESDGGHLAVLDDAAENAWFLSYIAANNGDAWLGLTDHVTNGTFRWVTDVPLGFVGWPAPEPNDLNGDEDCGHVYLLNGGWNDNFCGAAMPYACECDGRTAVVPRTYCNTDSDPQNCGTCGNVCGSGTCTNQVCN